MVTSVSKRLVLRTSKYGLSLVLVLFLCACVRQPERLELPALGPLQIAPLWSMPVGCEGGFRLDDGKLTTIHRMFFDEYYQWTLDVLNGHVLNRSELPVRRTGTPGDTVVEVSGGKLKPLDPSSVRSIMLPGFKPVVATDRFIFAKKTRLGFSFPRFIRYGQVVLIDRTTQEAVWLLDGIDVTVQASPMHVFVCDSRKIAAFTPQGGRPQEITDFYSAIRRGDAEKAQELFPAWKRTPLYDLDGHDPLAVAAKEGKVDVIRQLLKLGLSPNEKSADGYSPLLMALNWEHPDVVSVLLDAGADPNYNAEDWEYPLTKAVHAAKRPTIELLLKRGAKINQISSWSGRTALHEAVMYRNYEAVETLLDAGADAKVRDKDEKTPPQHAEDDECISHLFRGGRIADKPRVCAPLQTTKATFRFSDLR